MAVPRVGGIGQRVPGARPRRAAERQARAAPLGDHGQRAGGHRLGHEVVAVNMDAGNGEEQRPGLDVRES